MLYTCCRQIACICAVLFKAQHIIRESKKTKEARAVWLKELKAGTICINFRVKFKSSDFGPVVSNALLSCRMQSLGSYLRKSSSDRRIHPANPLLQRGWKRLKELSSLGYYKLVPLLPCTYVFPSNTCHA